MSGISLVTVPIGNAEDITLRALRVLKDSNYVFCEDTRVFKELCRKVGVEYSSKTIRSFHDHSSENKLSEIIDLAKTESCAFVSDAGSPLVSDPAYPLLKKALASSVEISSCGGISSVISSLELSALPPIPFHFHGFLSRGKISSDLEQMRSQYGTHIFFEGVSRVLATLDVLSSLYPDADIAVCRELTKEYESVHRFKGSEYRQIRDDIVTKGEFVVLFYNENKIKESSREIVGIVDDIFSRGMKPKLVAKLISSITGEKVKDIYQKLQHKQTNDTE